MLEQVLMELVARADAEQAVAVADLGNGAQTLQMLAYPLERGMLVGIGLEGDAAQQVDGARVLHKRAESMDRLGPWLPARLNDGAWYVLRRLPSCDPGRAPLEEDDLEAAVEMLK